jgi:leucyl-tRNA synthetase
MASYNPGKIEKKWQKEWEEKGIYQDYSRKEKFYVLDMFPYISGAGLHVGHPKGYIATDVVARMKMLQGYSVLHPMGWDAFGLPTENYAIKNKIHPRSAVDKNVIVFKKQLEKIGFTYDWDREIDTTDPEYYKWTQWIFLQLYKKGLAFESEEPVNWCPVDKTVLANEDLENGKCERCGSEVEQRKLRQWVLKMTAYADRLLYDLDKEKLDWPEYIKEQQRNWIGRSEGAVVKFLLKGISGQEDGRHAVEIFTTRVDTIFGVSFLAISPELAKKWLDVGWQASGEVKQYIEETLNKRELDRLTDVEEKTGVDVGIKAINPFNGEEVPVFVADYVLGSYGTGAVMAVPAHDERDFAFAKKYDLPIAKVILPPALNVMIRSAEDVAAGSKQIVRVESECFAADGELVNSGSFSGLLSADAREKMVQWLEKEGKGSRKVNYKMRDWVFSRQRYWGEPIPIIHCEKCGVVPVPEDELPLKLPDVKNYEPTNTGESPLANISEWVNVECPKCKGAAKRETNTMPQWAGSCWYYLRYIDPKNKKALVDKNLEKEWMPVDLYVGGAEHATRHLLYARFWHKFLYDIGAVSTLEPFVKLVNVGLILAEDGRKMSKRWNNVVNPDDVIKEFGADSLRLYEMFMGPFTQSIAWNTKGLIGARRFLDRVWDYFENYEMEEKKPASAQARSLLHKTIKKVGEDIINFRFNTAVSQMMVLMNELRQGEECYYLEKEELESILLLLSPFAPHMADELWNMLGHKESLYSSHWPQYDEKLLIDDIIDMPVQINGKVRDVLKVPADASDDQIKELALASEAVQKYLEGKAPKKVIVIPKRLISIVI